MPIQDTYRPLGQLNREHGVVLVQDPVTQKLYVQKQLPARSYSVLNTLQTWPVANMPQIFELEVGENGVTVVEEYLTGSTLQELLDSQLRLGPQETADYALQLCAILTDLHAAGIIHRDIKPTNIILSPDGVIKLIDVDAARRERWDAEQDTVPLGTVGYAAPEQYGTAATTPQTDLYSMGVLMNVMLCGQQPTVQMAAGPLEPVIRRCLQTNPKDRYPSAEGLAAAIRKAMEPKQEPEPERTALWRSLPGFRSGKPVRMLAAAVGYLLVLWMGMGAELENASGPAELWFNRLMLTAGLLGVVLFSGNFRGVQKRLPMTRSDHLPVRAMGVLLWDSLLLTGTAVVCGVLEALFWG